MRKRPVCPRFSPGFPRFRFSRFSTRISLFTANEKPHTICSVGFGYGDGYVAPRNSALIMSCKPSFACSFRIQPCKIRDSHARSMASAHESAHLRLMCCSTISANRSSLKRSGTARSSKDGWATLLLCAHWNSTTNFYNGTLPEHESFGSHNHRHIHQ
jgi:hypothetical protein